MTKFQLTQYFILFYRLIGYKIIIMLSIKFKMKNPMRKSIFISALLLVVLNLINAQDAILTLKPQSKFGVKLTTGLVTTSKEKINLPTQNGQTSIQFDKADIYYGLGLWSQHQFGWLFAESNILYNRYGMNYIMSNNKADAVSEISMQEKHDYVSGQLIAGLKYKGIRLGVGPSINVATGYENNLENPSSFEMKQRNISYSFSGVIGVDIKRVSIDLQFEKAFRSIGDHIYSDIRKSRFTETPDVLRVNVAYQLF